jgi:hypothetical protein
MKMIVSSMKCIAYIALAVGLVACSGGSSESSHPVVIENSESEDTLLLPVKFNVPTEAEEISNGKDNASTTISQKGSRRSVAH